MTEYSRTTIAATPCIDPGHRASIKKIWEGSPGRPGRLSWLKNRINLKLRNEGSQILYDTQVFTNNLLDYARRCRDLTMIDQLADLYLTAEPHLAVIDAGTDREHREWKNSPGSANEHILKSAQFVYLLARMTNTIGHLPPAERTARMNDFVARYSRVVLVDHLRRWVFARNADDAARAEHRSFSAAWSTCSDKDRYAHHQWLQVLGLRQAGIAPDYCNVVRDLDLWVIAATAEMVEATNLPQTPIPYDQLNTFDRTAYVTYVRQGIALIQSRITRTSLEDFQGRTVTGIVFDAGAWKNHPDYYFAGHRLPTKPTLANRKTVAGIGWDLSHSRRFVQVFTTLHEKRAALGSSFPTRDDMVQFANQFAYGVFNRNLDRPLFANYFDGTVGWYRVNYLGKTDLAYAPYGSSTAAFNGGFGFWAAYNPDIGTIMRAGLDTLATPSAFRDTYYTHDPGASTADEDPSYYYKWNRFDLDEGNSLDYLQFLPTLVNTPERSIQR